MTLLDNLGNCLWPMCLCDFGGLVNLTVASHQALTKIVSKAWADAHSACRGWKRSMIGCFRKMMISSASLADTIPHCHTSRAANGTETPMSGFFFRVHDLGWISCGRRHVFLCKTSHQMLYRCITWPCTVCCWAEYQSSNVNNELYICYSISSRCVK